MRGSLAGPRCQRASPAPFDGLTSHAPTGRSRSGKTDAEAAGWPVPLERVVPSRLSDFYVSKMIVTGPSLTSLYLHPRAEHAVDHHAQPAQRLTEVLVQQLGNVSLRGVEPSPVRIRWQLERSRMAGVVRAYRPPAVTNRG